MSQVAQEMTAGTGRSTTLLQLNGIPDLTVHDEVCATGLSPNGKYIAVVEQTGLIRILHRRERENTNAMLFSALYTQRGASFIAIDDEARFLLLMDWDDRAHTFFRPSVIWNEEPASLQIGMFKTYAHTFAATLKRDPHDRRHFWVISSPIDVLTYNLKRYRRCFRSGYCWY